MATKISALNTISNISDHSEVKVLCIVPKSQGSESWVNKTLDIRPITSDIQTLQNTTDGLSSKISTAETNVNNLISQCDTLKNTTTSELNKIKEQLKNLQPEDTNKESEEFRVRFLEKFTGAPNRSILEDAIHNSKENYSNIIQPLIDNDIELSNNKDYLAAIKNIFAIIFNNECIDNNSVIEAINDIANYNFEYSEPSIVDTIKNDAKDIKDIDEEINKVKSLIAKISGSENSLKSTLDGYRKDLNLIKSYIKTFNENLSDELNETDKETFIEVIVSFLNSLSDYEIYSAANKNSISTEYENGLLLTKIETLKIILNNWKSGTSSAEQIENLLNEISVLFENLGDDKTNLFETLLELVKAGDKIDAYYGDLSVDINTQISNLTKLKDYFNIEFEKNIPTNDDGNIIINQENISVIKDFVQNQPNFDDKEKILEDFNKESISLDDLKNNLTLVGNKAKENNELDKIKNEIIEYYYKLISKNNSSYPWYDFYKNLINSDFYIEVESYNNNIIEENYGLNLVDRIKEIDTKNKNTNLALLEIQNDIKDVENNISENDKSIFESNIKIENIETTLDSINESISNITNTVEEINQNISNIDTNEVKIVQTQVSELREEFDMLEIPKYIPSFPDYTNANIIVATEEMDETGMYSFTADSNGLVHICGNNIKFTLDTANDMFNEYFNTESNFSGHISLHIESGQILKTNQQKVLFAPYK